MYKSKFLLKNWMKKKNFLNRRFIVENLKIASSIEIIPKHFCLALWISRPVCLDKVGSDVICLINGLTTSSSALIRAKLIVNRLTVWTFSLRAKSCDKTQNHVTKPLCQLRLK